MILSRIFLLWALVLLFTLVRGLSVERNSPWDVLRLSILSFCPSLKVQLVFCKKSILALGNKNILFPHNNVLILSLGGAILLCHHPHGKAAVRITPVPEEAIPCQRLTSPRTSQVPAHIPAWESEFCSTGLASLPLVTTDDRFMIYPDAWQVSPPPPASAPRITTAILRPLSSMFITINFLIPQRILLEF